MWLEGEFRVYPNKTRLTLRNMFPSFQLPCLPYSQQYGPYGNKCQWVTPLVSLQIENLSQRDALILPTPTPNYVALTQLAILPHIASDKGACPPIIDPKSETVNYTS